MRLPIILVLVSSSAALAEPSTADHVKACNLDPAMVPEVCQPLAVGLPLEAKVSIASCIATVNLLGLTLSDTASSYAALGEAVRPSITMLDEVIATGEPRSTLEALATKAGLIDAMVVRMRISAPPLTAKSTPRQIQLSTERHDAIEVAVADWRNESKATNQKIVELAMQHSDLLANPVVAFDVRRAEAAEGVVATR